MLSILIDEREPESGELQARQKERTSDISFAAAATKSEY
jgi:hypothetical protein